MMFHVTNLTMSEATDENEHVMIEKIRARCRRHCVVLWSSLIVKILKVLDIDSKFNSVQN